MGFLFFDQAGADNAGIFGGKAASLGRLATAANVPPGFAISVAAYREWEAAGGGEMPSATGEGIRQAYAELERRTETADVPVAVRSSAVDEDGVAAPDVRRHQGKHRPPRRS